MKNFYVEMLSLLKDKISIMTIWDQINNIEEQIRIVETYYVGEQTIIIVSIDKKIVNSKRLGYVSLLKRLICSDNEWRFSDIDVKNEKELIEVDNIIWEYLIDYEPIEFNYDTFIDKILFDYKYCIKTREEYRENSDLIRAVLKNQIINKKIINGIQLIDNWNEYEYFIETEKKYILYSWNTSA
ncbi:hypothetical protein [Tepidibacter hydrothermalis]|uniref:Uncharacterized protein n=1 Tax=Tepidibacter hydrothermalis TaxID=3036126 RepID=A0ABY8EL24_9FIRM|nr:hypothetical protein [Tepidibacter hydrothermalis]WFD11938.1 hypothetical protein P4S50_07640 [Tepidibacter hydrothermalis]